MSHKKKREEQQPGTDFAEEDISNEAERAFESAWHNGRIDSEQGCENDIEERITSLENEKQEISDRLLRTMAEFDNYRKRVTREKEGLVKYGTEKLALELLPLVDNFERALEQSRQSADVGPVVAGLEMILKQLMATLEKFQITAFNAIGEQFNPEFHEAMAQQEHEDYDDNTVIDQFQKGYMLGDKLLRPARVLVSRAPASEED